MRKFIVFAVILSLALVSCTTPEGRPRGGASFNPGTYIVIGAGYRGPIPIEVVFSRDAIESVRVLSHKETHLIGNIPIQRYPALIVANQSLAIDIVTGATISSFAVLNAVREAVVKAGGNPNAPSLNTPVHWTVEPAVDVRTDVVVIGGGGAGLTAAIHAAMAGSNVILVEKLTILGGTTTYVIEGFGASQSFIHRNMGVTANWETQVNGLMISKPRGRREAFEVLTQNNARAADWMRSIGGLFPVSAGPIGLRSDREAGPLGITIVAALMAEAEKKGVDIRTNTQAVELVTSGGAVTGVRVQNRNGTYTISAGSVIMATGGFAANNEKVASFQPHLAGRAFASAPGARGDGHRMAEAVGAYLSDMDHIRVNFSYQNHNGFVFYTAAIVNTGGIFVNNSGRRVINEGGGYFMGPIIAEQHGGEGWMIFDNSIVNGTSDVRQLYYLGLFISAPTIEELADKTGIPRANLLDTIETYRRFVAQGRDEQFNRHVLHMDFLEPPFFASRSTVHVQGTFGGITTNFNTEVLRADGSVIPNFFAAGECANLGTWGANPVVENTVFGRIAGENAAANAR